VIRWGKSSGLEAVFGMREKRGRGYWGNCENCRREEFGERQGIEVAVVEDRGFWGED
jgi:hypothetical protein